MKDKGEKVLIVDDEPDICWALEHILKAKGLSSKKTTNASDALAMIGSNCFRLVFLDAKLPDMEGFDLAHSIRRLDPRIRIVMISGYFYEYDASVHQALSQGLIHGFINKPFLHHEIQKVTELMSSLYDLMVD